MSTSSHVSSPSIVNRAARRVSRVARHPANNALVQALLAKCVQSLRGTTAENCSKRAVSSSSLSSSLLTAPSCSDSFRLLRAARFASQHAFPIADSLPLLEDLQAAKENAHFLADAEDRGAKALSYQTSLPFDVLEAAVELYTECPFLLVRDWRGPSFSSFSSSSPSLCPHGGRSLLAKSCGRQKSLALSTPNTESKVKCPSPPINASPKSKSQESFRGGPLMCNFAPSRTLMSAREAEFIFEQIREVVRDHLEASHESRFSNRGRIRSNDPSMSLTFSSSFPSHDVHEKQEVAHSQPLLGSRKAAVVEKVAWAHKVKLSPIGANLRGKLFTPDLHILMTHSGVTKAAVRNRRARTNEGHDGRAFILPRTKTKMVISGSGGGVPEDEVKSFERTRRFGGLALGEVAEGEEEDESITVEALNVILFKVARALELSGVAQKELIVHSNLPDTVSMKLKTFPRRAPSLTQYYCQNEDFSSFVPNALSIGLPKGEQKSKEETSRKASSLDGDSSRLFSSSSTLTPHKDHHQDVHHHRQLVEFPSRTVYLHVVPWCLYPARLALLSCEMDKSEINADKRKGGCAPHYRGHVNEVSNGSTSGGRRHVRQRSWFGPTGSLCGSLKSRGNGSPLALGEACSTALANLELTAEASGLRISYKRGVAPKE